MSKKAQELAARYGRKSDIIEIVQDIINEQYHVSAFSKPKTVVEEKNKKKKIPSMEFYKYPIVTSDEEIQAFSWGLIPFWVKPKINTEEGLIKELEQAASLRTKTFNARSETIFEKPSFRVPIYKKRCLIPSTGYFEYHHNEDNTTTPYYIFLKNEEVFSMAGVYDSWINPLTGVILNTFSLITTDANELTGWIHNGGDNPHRMPVILSRSEEEKWLDADLTKLDIQSMMKPFEDEYMDAYPINKELFMKANSHDKSIIAKE